jgi:DNA-binding LytR/AlgR family response regulator
MTTQILIADDEEAPREHLRRLLAGAWPDAELVAACANGVDAWDEALAHEPAVCFLDIRMPGLTGLEVAQRLQALAAPPQVVFVTAYNDHALAAFEAGAADYLVKPLDLERLQRCVARLKGRLASSSAPAGPDLQQLLAQLLPVRAGRMKPIQASLGKEVRLIQPEEVQYFESDARYTRVVTLDGEALIRTPLKELVAGLDPELFWQVHRSVLVNSRCIASAVRVDENSMHLTLKGREREAAGEPPVPGSVQGAVMGAAVPAPRLSRRLARVARAARRVRRAQAAPGRRACPRQGGLPGRQGALHPAGAGQLAAVAIRIGSIAAHPAAGGIGGAARLVLDLAARLGAQAQAQPLAVAAGHARDAADAAHGHALRLRRLDTLARQLAGQIALERTALASLPQRHVLQLAVVLEAAAGVVVAGVEPPVVAAKAGVARLQLLLARAAVHLGGAGQRRADQGLGSAGRGRKAQHQGQGAASEQGAAIHGRGRGRRGIRGSPGGIEGLVRPVRPTACSAVFHIGRQAQGQGHVGLRVAIQVSLGPESPAFRVLRPGRASARPAASSRARRGARG